MLLRILLILSIIFMVSCSKNDEPIYQTSKKKINAYELYKEGLEAFEQNDYFFASKNFLKQN